MREVAVEHSRSSEPSHWVARHPYRSRTMSPVPSPSGRPRPPALKPGHSWPQVAPNRGRRSGALRHTGSTHGPKFPSTAPLKARSRDEPGQVVDETHESAREMLSVPHVGMPAKRWALSGMGPAAKSSTKVTTSSTDAPTHPCSAKANSPPSPSPAGKTDDSTPSSPDTRVELSAYKSALSGEPLATIRQCNSALTYRCTASRRWPSRSLPSTRCRSSGCPQIFADPGIDGLRNRSTTNDIDGNGAKLLLAYRLLDCISNLSWGFSADGSKVTGISPPSESELRRISTPDPQEAVARRTPGTDAAASASAEPV